ncbi:MAG: hypothetical protein NTY02_00025 [Acidobacteria bacterium]|nr:hypothetical protein [Acidobacteriota bacterium]
MPFDCRFRQRHGQEACLTRCPAAPPVCDVVRVERPDQVPPARPNLIDIAVLDMHHGWPNLGHGAILHAMQNAVCDISASLCKADIGFRIFSYDIRSSQAMPEPPGGRHLLYVGTGGPGHLDPRMNDGISEGSQGIAEDPSWEPGLFALFDRIRAHEDAALLAVCHTFGVMSRWLGIADAVLRGPEKGGKSTGVVESILTDAAVAHPWFSRFAEALPDHRRLRVLDNRLYDLIPRGPLPAGITAIGYETLGVGGPRGDALTMIEVARDRAGVLPRIFGVNHHPEIVNRPRLLVMLEKMFAQGDVTREWYEERRLTLTEPVADEWGDRLINLTSSYTFMGPLRFHLYKLARLRGIELGRPLDIDEAMLPLTYHFQRSAAPRK